MWSVGVANGCFDRASISESSSTETTVSVALQKIEKGPFVAENIFLGLSLIIILCVKWAHFPQTVTYTECPCICKQCIPGCFSSEYTVEPLIKDTLNKGHLCIKDTFQCTNLYSGNTFLPLKEANLSIMDKMICPNVSVI